MRDLSELLKLHIKLIKLAFQNKIERIIFSVINKEEFQKATNVLYKCGNYEDSLLIYHVVVSIKTKWNTHNKIWRFWFYYQATINYYSNKKNQRKKFTIPDDLNNKAIEFKTQKRDKESILRKQLQHQQERKFLDILYLT